MNTKKRPSVLLAAFTILMFGACEEWGKMDPPPGTDKNPKLEQIARITFEEEEFDPSTMDYYAYPDGEAATVEDDEAHGRVLHLNGGYARMANPLAATEVQNGVSLTFWVKQALLTDEDSGEALENDLEGALFSFVNTNATQRMYFTANGELRYDGVDGSYDSHAAGEVKTGLLTPAGEWHYVALAVRDDGYSVYVDGLERIDHRETNFDFDKIVQFMAGTSYLYIGYGAQAEAGEMWIDELTLYRNQITAREQALPGSGGEEEVYERYVTVGSADNTTGFFAAQSPLMTIAGDNTLRMGFTNYTPGTQNYFNWVFVLTNGKAFGEDGYLEHFVLRADAFGWGDAGYNAANIAIDWTDWDAFRADMNGAEVEITMERTASNVKVTSVTKGMSGKLYTQTFSYDGAQEETIGAFLTVDNSHLEVRWYGPAPLWAPIRE